MEMQILNVKNKAYKIIRLITVKKKCSTLLREDQGTGIYIASQTHSHAARSN